MKGRFDHHRGSFLAKAAKQPMAARRRVGLMESYWATCRAAREWCVYGASTRGWFCGCKSRSCADGLVSCIPRAWSCPEFGSTMPAMYTMSYNPSDSAQPTPALMFCHLRLVRPHALCGLRSEVPLFEESLRQKRIVGAALPPGYFVAGLLAYRDGGVWP